MKQNAFTLAELLIALLILGVIATFTIPKVLQSQQSSQHKTTAKEAASMVSGAYQAFLQDSGNWRYIQASDLTPYMNYVTVDSTTNDPEYNCTLAGVGCLRLHSGGMLNYFVNNNYFCEGPGLTALFFIYDPDGNGDANIAGVPFLLYDNGRLTTMANPVAGSTYADGPDGVCDNVLGTLADPPWFNWD